MTEQNFHGELFRTIVIKEAVGNIYLRRLVNLPVVPRAGNIVALDGYDWKVEFLYIESNCVTVELRPEYEKFDTAEDAKMWFSKELSKGWSIDESVKNRYDKLISSE